MLQKTRYRFTKILTGQYPVSEAMFEKVNNENGSFWNMFKAEKNNVIV